MSEQEPNSKVVFGLEAQGHIETIEKLLVAYGGSTHLAWQEIGKQIGWCPLTACAHYVRYLLNKPNPPILT